MNTTTHATIGLFVLCSVAACGSTETTPYTPAPRPWADGARADRAQIAEPSQSAQAEEGSDYEVPPPSAAAPERQASSVGSSAGAAPASKSRGSYEPQELRRERDDDRPGLATTWGETLSSEVTTVSFERERDEPSATTALFYNDREGLSAMLRSPTFSHAAAGMSQVGPVRVRIIDQSGRAFSTFQSGAHRYVVGEPGERYTIQIDNQSSERVEAVATVDGLDVIDGETGSFSKRGYVISPWSTLSIDGFRQSEDSVAAFRFGRVSDSYAAQKGDARNVGVIGVAVFRERRRPRYLERESELRNTADPFPSRFATPPPMQHPY